LVEFTRPVVANRKSLSDRERAQDEAAVSKLLKDITTGALRRKRGAGDDLDLSDEEDEAARRRETKRREFARMRRELLKDEAVGKIAEDKKKQAFLKSIEDHDDAGEDEDVALDGTGTPQNDAVSQPQQEVSQSVRTTSRKRPLDPSTGSMLNRLPPSLRRTANPSTAVDRKPATLAQIRQSVSFLLDDGGSQTVTATADDLSAHSSDTDENERGAYVDLDRHLHAADSADEDAGDDLADFIVADEPVFRKPAVPAASQAASSTSRRARVKGNVVDRLSLTRQNSSSSSSSSSSSASGKLAFFTSRSTSDSQSSKVPPLLRRATTNSSVGSSASVTVRAATGVTTTAAGPASNDDGRERSVGGVAAVAVRKARGAPRRNAVNYSVTPREEVQRNNRLRKSRGAGAGAKGGTPGRGGFLGQLFTTGGSWG
jgi:mediator of replication checkpoint protein 1